MMQLIFQQQRFGIMEWAKYTPLSLAFFLFAIPINNTLQSISFVAVVILLLSEKATYHVLARFWREPWIVAVLAFYLLVLLACLWSPAGWGDMSYVVKKYSKLMFLPLLAIGFRDQRARAYGLVAFMLAMTLTSLVAFIKAFFPELFSNHTPGFVFRNYIMTGHMTALASYLSLYLAFRPASMRLFSPWLYMALFGMFSVQLLFLSIGRTGYIVYFLLMALFIVQHLPKKQCLLAAVAFTIAGGFMLQANPKMQQGFTQIYQNLAHYQQGDKDTSVGFRLQFQQFAWQLLKQSPWIGHGSGSYTYFFKKDNPVPAWSGVLREPHNQYMLILAEYGLLGLMAYALMLLALIRACWQLETLRALAFAVFVPFLVGCLSDSLLFYSASGYFVLALLALCLGEQVGLKSSA